MPISNKRFTEIRFMISDFLQRGAWQELYENCGTSDYELAKSVANIFSMFQDPPIWKYANYVSKLEPEKRREHRDSTLVVCLALGKIGKSDVKQAIKLLRIFLSDDHMLRGATQDALANLWIYNRKTSERALYDSYILKGEDNDDLQAVAVGSSELLLSHDPKSVAPFVNRVLAITNPKLKTAVSVARELHAKYGIPTRVSRARKSPKKPSRKTKRKKPYSKRKKTRHSKARKH
ncbi:MAG: hypothetical protein ACYCQJ_09525 [Nitrososphaerales archaeon]